MTSAANTRGQGTEQAPSVPPVQVERIPEALHGYGHFVLWQYKLDPDAKDGEIRWRKVPLVADAMHGASSTDPRTWRSHTLAVKAYQRAAECESGRYGLGFMFAKAEPRYPDIKPGDVDPFTFVDLDHCRDPDSGRIDEWAWEIIRNFNTYTEASPSGTGVHLYVRASGRGPYKLELEGHQVELYQVARFTTLTGQHIAGTPDDITDGQAAVDWLADLLDVAKAARNGHQERPHAPRNVRPLKLTDTQLLSNIRSSNKGEWFHSLYDDGDWESLYPSQSEDVWALLGTLAWLRRRHKRRILHVRDDVTPPS